MPDTPDTDTPDTGTPDPPAPAADADTPQEGEFDPERAKAKIAKVNAEARRLRERLKQAEAAEKRLAEIEDADKTEAQKQAEALDALKQENLRLQSQMLRAEVASTKGVPADLLSGSTAEELEASADALLAFAAKSGGGTRPDFGAGPRGTPVGPSQLSRDDLAGMTNDQINQARTEGRLDRLMGRIP